MQYLAPHIGMIEPKVSLGEGLIVFAGLMIYATKAMLFEDRGSLRAISIVASFPMGYEQACLLVFHCNGSEDI